MRRPFSVLTALALVFFLTTDASAGGKGKKKEKQAKGSVSAVEKDTLTVKVAPKKKSGGEATEQKFKLTADTKYERTVKVKGQKGQTEAQAAKFEDLKPGDTVTITAKGDQVEKVVIAGKAKKKKADK